MITHDNVASCAEVSLEHKNEKAVLDKLILKFFSVTLLKKFALALC